MKRYFVIVSMLIIAVFLSNTKAMNIKWVYISDPGVSGHEGFSWYMSKYETTNSQYCEFLNAALVSGDITVSGNSVLGANGSNSGTDYVGQVYYDLAGPGINYDGATNGGAARINWTGSTFTVDSGFGNHPVTNVSWYGATAFCNYYGYRLPTRWEWQAVADYDGTFAYGCGTSINNNIANYAGSVHPYGTTVVGFYGENGYGLCDMAGNVEEFMSTSGGSSYDCGHGGGWEHHSGYCTVSYVTYGSSYGIYEHVGFRVVAGVEPPTGLVGYWSFDNASDAGHDDSGNHHNLIMSGPWSSVTGTSGNAISTETSSTSGSHVSTSGMNYPTSSGFSVGYWFKVSSTSGYVTDVRDYWEGVACGETFVLQFQGATKTAEFHIRTDFTNVNETSISVPVNAPDGTWVHLLGVYNANGYMASLYVNSVLGGSKNMPGAMRSQIAPYLWVNGSPYGTLQGVIDEVRIFNCALNQAEMQELYALAHAQYHVDTNGGNDSNDGLTRATAFATAQHGIEQSDDLDTIHVWPGVYNETVDFLGKAITVQSAADAAVITWPDGYGVRFHTTEGQTSVLKNFVIRDCQIGIQAESSSPKIEHVTVVNNTQGIVADGVAIPVITNSIVWDNSNGGLVDCDSSFSWVQDQLADNVDGLIAYYPFNNNLEDISGHGFDLIVPSTYQFISGQVGQCVHFDEYSLGSTNWGSVPEGPYVSTSGMNYPGVSGFTASFWGYVVENNVVSIGDYWQHKAGGEVFGLYANDASNQILFTLRDDFDNVPSPLQVSSAPYMNHWVYVAGVYEPNGYKRKLYVNGELVAQDSLPGPMRTQLPPYFYVSGSWHGTYETTIDEVRLYNRSLSESEIQQQYARESLGYGLGDPIFADPNDNDFHLRSEDGRFFPVPAVDLNMFGGADGAWIMDVVTSPCIDAGNPAENPSAERMPNGGRVNMGAYGGTAYASMSEYPLQGDINRDGIVNMEDLAAFSLNWLKALPWVD